MQKFQIHRDVIFELLAKIKPLANIKSLYCVYTIDADSISFMIHSIWCFYFLQQSPKTILLYLPLIVMEYLDPRHGEIDK